MRPQPEAEHLLTLAKTSTCSVASQHGAVTPPFHSWSFQQDKEPPCTSQDQSPHLAARTQASAACDGSLGGPVSPAQQLAPQGPHLGSPG